MSADDEQGLAVENAILRQVGARFADPEDAVMNLRNADVLADGKVDASKLTAAADAVLKAKPHLAAGRRVAPRQGAGGVSNRDDERMDRIRAAVKARTGIT